MVRSADTAVSVLLVLQAYRVEAHLEDCLWKHVKLIVRVNNEGLYDRHLHCGTD